MAEMTQDHARRVSLGEISRVVPGLYGWVATVLLPVAQRGTSSWARLAAALAVLALAGSFVLGASRPRLARQLGVYGFTFACLLSWALLAEQIRSDHLDAVRGALGALGFLLHALAWGAPPRLPEGPAGAHLVPGVPLVARHAPVRGAPLALGLGVLVALLSPAAAFAVERPAAALFAHAAALIAAVLCISAAAEVALRIGRSRQFPSWRGRAGRAIWPLGGLTLALGIGLIWAALR